MGIIHRDLKPQNILVTDTGTAKIADFGIASIQSLTQFTQTDVIMGSLHYLAPELARGEKATVQSDIYALGIVFYELLRGQVPFNGESPVNIALKHMQEDLPSLREFNPSIPQSVENIIIKATAKNLNDRYKSATEMLEDLQTCLSRTDEEKLVFDHSDEVNDPTIVVNPRQIFDEEEPEEVEERAVEKKNNNGKRKQILEKLKNPNKYGKDYFDELLEIIKEIRTSERRFYQKVTDIFAECSIDYNKNSEVAKDFYATIQNKFHYAITNETAAEIIYNRANSKKEHMGLTSWKHSPEGRILKSDVSIAKNYLTSKELEFLQDIVNMYLDIAENRAKRQIPMKMKDWVEELNTMLKTNRYEVLDNKGTISSEQAKEFAEKEFEKFRVEQDKKYISDFDKIIDECKKNN